MTEYPNREHEKADKAARRRAGAKAGLIAERAGYLASKLSKDGKLYAADAQTLISMAGDLREELAILETLRDVREWHAADEAEKSTYRGTHFRDVDGNVHEKEKK